MVVDRCRTYLVGIVPNGDTNTPGNSHAGLNDRHVICFLLFQVGIGGRELNTVIKFRHSNFKTKSSESLHISLQFAWRHVTKDEVALKTDAMNGHASCQEILNKLDHRIDLGAYKENIDYHHGKCKGTVAYRCIRDCIR